MVATNVQSRHPNALLAINKWKAVWQAGTFGSDEQFAEALVVGEPDVEELLTDFGTELISKGREVWNVQAQALAQMSFTKQWQSK